MKRNPFPALAIAISLAAIPSLCFAKTVKECDAEWTANKPAIQAGGETKRAFVTRCRADTATKTAPLTKSASPEPAPTPAPSASTTTQPQPHPAPGRTAKATPPPAATAAPSKANQFMTEAEAKSHCPGELVVWANTHSSIYHYAGTRNYGTTKSGAYMCERDTTAAGIRAAKNENPSR